MNSQLFLYGDGKFGIQTVLILSLKVKKYCLNSNNLMKEEEFTGIEGNCGVGTKYMIKHMIGEQMDILNSDFINQKLESLNRRVEQLQCKDNHEEIAKALLKKVSKLERRIDAVIAFQEESLSKMAVHQDFRGDYCTYEENKKHHNIFSFVNSSISVALMNHDFRDLCSL
ncbi:hypothetical protein Q9966_002746 [Columba livia]|nr:hypothetical protein Q9966_002746 [Columba livia]